MEVLLTASAGELKTTASNNSTVLTNKTQDQVRVLDPKTGTALLTFRQSFAHRHGLVVIRGRGSSYTYGGGRGKMGCDHIAIAQKDRPAIHFWSWGREPPRMRCSLPVRVGPMSTTGDGRYLFGGTREGRLLVWDTLTGELVQAIDAHLKAVTVVRTMKDSSHVITGGQDADVFVWSISDLLDGASGVRAKKKRKKRQDEEDANDNTSASSSTSSATSSKIQGTYVEPVCTWNAHTLGITDVLVGWCSTQGTTATSSLDHTVKFWKHGSRAPLHSITFPTFVNCLASDAEQRTLFVGGGDGSVYFVSMRAVASERHATTAVGFSTSSSSTSSDLASTSASSFSISSSSSTSSVSSAMTPSASMEVVEGCHAGPILSMVHSGTTLYTGGGDGVVCAWDSGSRQQLYTVVHAGPVTNLAMVPRPTDLLRSRQQGAGRSGRNANASLRPLPPLQKHRRVDHIGSVSTFLTSTSGVNTMDNSMGSGQDEIVSRRAVKSMSKSGTKGGEGGSSGSGNSTGNEDVTSSMVARLAELESENLRWQTLATKLRGMLNEKNKNGSSNGGGKRRKT